jgi:hypothetical protein
VYALSLDTAIVSEQVAPRPNGKARSFEFSKSLQAAIELYQAEGNVLPLQWALGDALVEEIGEPAEKGVRNKSKQKLERLQDQLKKHGVDYGAEHLRDLWYVAHHFPPEDRSTGIGWTLHRKAGTAEILKQAMEAADKTGAPLTVKFIAAFREQKRREQAKKQRKSANLDDQPEANAALLKALENYGKNIIVAQDRIADNRNIIERHCAELSEEQRENSILGVEEVIAQCEKLKQLLSQ